MVLGGWRWGPGHYLPWWLQAGPPGLTRRLRTGMVALRADLQLVEVALPPHRHRSPPCAEGRTEAQDPALVCRQGLSRGHGQGPWPWEGALGPGGPWAATLGWGQSRYQGVGLTDSGVEGWGRHWEESEQEQQLPGRGRGASCAAPRAGLPPQPHPPPCGAAAALGPWAVGVASSSVPCRIR